MKLITRDTDYALRAICFIAKNKNKITPVARLVSELKVPRPFLRKILQQLNKKGVLSSYKGQGGGFELAKRTEKILVTDIMRIFQGPMKLNECFLKKLACPHTNSCPLKKKIGSIEQYVKNELSSITVASLLR
jgi:Rrf2 family protein